MGSMDELRSPSLPTRPAAPVIVFPSPSMLSVLQLLGTIRCPKKPRAAHPHYLGSRSKRRRARRHSPIRSDRFTATWPRTAGCPQRQAISDTLLPPRRLSLRPHFQLFSCTSAPDVVETLNDLTPEMATSWRDRLLNLLIAPRSSLGRHGDIARLLVGFRFM